MAGYTVECSDLRGWASQVSRASDDMGAAHKYALGQIADADFGKILELITGPYAGLLEPFHSVLEADGTRLGKTSEALKTAEKIYQGMESEAGDRFAKLDAGEQGTVEDDGEASAFKDGESGAAELTPPNGDVTLPEVSLGFPFDQICDLCAQFTGFDPREKITQWIAGDVGKAMRQSSAWTSTANCTDAVNGNLKAGQAAISNTWTGEASNAAAKHVSAWLKSLTEQGTGMRQMGEHLKTAVDEAVKMAQVVVDIVKTVFSLLSSAWANAAIPGYGQWKLIKTVKDGVSMLWNAVKVINVFKSFIVMIVDFVKAVVASFNVSALPPAPAGGPA